MASGETNEDSCIRMLASRHWTGEALRLEPMLTVAGVGLLIARIWWVGLGFLVAAGVLGTILCWLYVSAEAAGKANDPLKNGERVRRLRDVDVGPLAIRILLAMLLLAVVMWLRWWPTTKGFLGE